MMRLRQTVLRCGQCGMAGLLRKKFVPILPDNALSPLTPTDYDSVNDEIEAKEILACMTCWPVGVGMKSENQLHKRLPEEEYAK